MIYSRFWKRRITAPNLKIQHSLPWPIKIGATVLVLGLGGALALWTYDLGRNFAFGSKQSAHEFDAMREQVAKLTLERDRLASGANTIENQKNIDKSMQKELTEQIGRLTAENNKLKDDLAFFESLMPSANRPVGISLSRFTMEKTGANQASYRILVMQGGKATKEFSGELRFSLTLEQAGKSVMMDYPDAKLGEAGKLKVAFKHYQRLEGVINLPEGAVVKSAQATILEKGELRAKQLIHF